MINKEEYILKRGAKRAIDKYTHPHTTHNSNKKEATKKEVQKHPHLQWEPNKSMKLINLEGPSLTNILASEQRKQTKDPFSLWMESMLSSKAILFIVFQTVQKRHKRPTLQTFLCFLPTNEPFQPKSIALTKEGSTQDTPKRVKKTSYKTLIFTHRRSMDSSCIW